MTTPNHRRISGVQGHRRSLGLDDEFAGQQIGGLVVGVQVLPSLTLEFPLVNRDIVPGRSGAICRMVRECLAAGSAAVGVQFQDHPRVVNECRLHATAAIRAHRTEVTLPPC